MTSVPPQRAPKRVAMACTYCRRRKIKCEPQTSPNYSCKNCSDRRQQCTYLPVEFDDPNAPQLQQSLSPSPEAPYFPTASNHTSMQYPGHPQDNMWPQQSQQMQQAYTQQRGMPGYTMPGDGGRTHHSAMPDAATHGYNQGWNTQYGQGFALPDGGSNTAFSYPPQATDGVHNASSSGYNPYSSSNAGSVSAAPPMYCQCTPGPRAQFLFGFTA
ncbi:Zn(2)-C6 fungal-type domain-containing protein [Pleurotus pulmonarius]